MEEQTSWKGHSFTLLVFTGIVVLCSIFFILGMLVGRAQGQKMASLNTPAAVTAQSKPASDEDKADFTFYDSVKKDDPAVQQPPTEPPAPPPSSGVAPLEGAPARKSAEVMNYQIGAVRKSEDAEKLLEELHGKGFRAFILAPAPDDPNPFFRVQVGPIRDSVEAEEVKNKLESAGYRPILRK